MSKSCDIDIPVGTPVFMLAVIGDLTESEAFPIDVFQHTYMSNASQTITFLAPV